MDAFAGLMSMAMVTAALVAAVVIWRAIPPLYTLGLGVFPIIAFGALAVLTGVLDLATKGRHHLASLVIALSGMTFFAGVLSTGMGLLTTLRFVTEMDVPDPWLIAVGTYESMGNLVAGTAMAGASLLIWGVARRRALRSTGD